jgi:hypothetical protein
MVACVNALESRIVGQSVSGYGLASAFLLRTAQPVTCDRSEY